MPSRFHRRFAARSRFTWAVALSTVLLGGCADVGGDPAAQATPAQLDAQRREVAQRLFDSAVDSLNRLNDYDEGQVDSAVGQLVRRLNEALDSGLLDTQHNEPFTDVDGSFLREAVWLRAAARFAVGDETSVHRRAELLFDWVVRNLQPIAADAPVEERLPYLPWHMMLLGRGSQLDRSWLFLHLARQQGLDVVLLAPAEAKPDLLDTPVWPALVDGGELYVFDPQTALPIADAAGTGIATLAQIQQNDGLVRALDGEKEPHPLSAAATKKFVAYFDASSPFVDPKFERLERLLSGDSKLVLSIDRDGLTTAVKQSAGVGEVRPWPLRDERFAATRSGPNYERLMEQLKTFRTLAFDGGQKRLSSPLWRPRIRHITGNYAAASAAQAPLTRLYQDARPSDAELVGLRSSAELWAYAYRIKQTATYWLGLVSYDLKNYDTAVHYFELVLKDEANGGWITGARYNLGRTLEAAGKPSEAIEAYRATHFGRAPDDACLFRARRLEASKAKGAVR